MHHIRLKIQHSDGLGETHSYALVAEDQVLDFGMTGHAVKPDNPPDRSLQLVYIASLSPKRLLIASPMLCTSFGAQTEADSRAKVSLPRHF